MLTITDLFCGAGGSSSGAEQVPGVRVRMAANHWRLAVDTHQANLPWTDHDCADLSQVDPARYPRTDILWASPSCTHHSRAQGRRKAGQPGLFDHPAGQNDAAERSRATMWDVCRFAEHHRYRAMVVENVVDVRDWVMWPAWRHALDCLGYHTRPVYLNSMHAAQLGRPAPQSRDRLYVVCWRRGEKAPDLDRWTRPVAHCPTCDRQVTAVQAWKRPDRHHGRYRAQYVYRCPNGTCRNREVHPPVLPAAVAIDWTVPGELIGARARPLAPATLARIAAGLRRYTATSDAALVRVGRPAGFVMRNNTARGDGGQMCTPFGEPLRTLTTAGHQSLVTWMTVSYYRTGATRPVSEPIGTLTTRDRYAVCSVAPAVDDCLFRMLGVSEIRAGMAFPDHFHLLGTAKGPKVRMLGNAVTPPAARDLVAAVAEAITGQTVARPGGAA